MSPVGAFGRNDGITPWVQLSIASLIAGSPQASTNTTSSRYGLQAMKISRPVCFMATVLTGLSPSSRMMFAGFHSLSTATITMMQVSELRMSVSSGPMVLETKSCMPANDSPQAMIAGSTSRARAQPAITTIR